MEKNQYELCLEVLRRLSRSGVLKDIILVGSWCLPFYRDYFSTTRYSPMIRTRDVDFLVLSPSSIHARVNIPELLKDIGFIMRHRGSKGYIRLEHPDLMVEFFSPEKGPGTDNPIDIPKLGVNAQALRYLNFLATNIIIVDVEDFSLYLPHPVYFALHKLIIFQRRSKKDKADKDREAAVMLLRALIRKGENALVKSVFDSTLPSWRKSILKGLQNVEDKDIVKVLIK